MAKLNIGTWVRMKPKDRWRGIHGRIAEIEGDPADPSFTLVLDGSLSFLAARENFTPFPRNSNGRIRGGRCALACPMADT